MRNKICKAPSSWCKPRYFQAGFFISVAVALIVTAGIKIYTLVFTGDELKVADPLLTFLSVGGSAGMATLLEAIVVIILLTRTSTLLKCGAIAWLSCAFLTYRFGLWLIAYEGKCFCLGGAQSWLQLVAEWNVDRILNVLLLYMLLGSAAFLFHGLAFNVWTEAGRLSKSQ